MNPYSDIEGPFFIIIMLISLASPFIMLFFILFILKQAKKKEQQYETRYNREEDSFSGNIRQPGTPRMGLPSRQTHENVVVGEVLPEDESDQPGGQ